jgi:hypothetical protein
MDNKILCECGVTFHKSNLYRHKKSKSHLDKMKKLEEQNADERQEDEESIQDETPIENIENIEEDNEEDTEEKEEKVIEKPVLKKNGKSKEYMDMIRQKAHETLRRKKQEKIDKENMIKKKAEEYDILVKSLKEKEEEEKKRKEVERLKEIEYKSKEYDKMIKMQERNQVINNITQGKIIDDIKEQRLYYLMKYLNNPNHF